MVQADAASRDSRIAELELRLSEAKNRSLKAEEGRAVAESYLLKSNEAEETTLDSFRRESTRSTSLEIALVGAEHFLAQAREELQSAKSTRAILADPELMESNFYGLIVFHVLEKDLQQAGVDFLRVCL